MSWLTAIAILLVVFLVIAVLIFIPLNVKFIYTTGDPPKIAVEFLRLKFCFDQPTSKEGAKPARKPIEKPAKSGTDEPFEVESTLQKIQTIVTAVGDGVHIKSLNVDITIGLGDAAATGVAVGIIWATIPIVFQIIVTNFRLDEHRVDVSPVYNGQIFKAKIDSIISTNLFKLMIMLGIIIREMP